MADKCLADWIRGLIATDTLYKFYKCDEWLKLRADILEENHNECAWCKDAGKIETAVTVHHVQAVKKYPELALSKFFYYRGRRHKNLVPLCHDCHDKAHKRMQFKPKPKPLTPERW